MAWAPPQAGRDPSGRRAQAVGSEVASAVGPTGGRGGAGRSRSSPQLSGHQEGRGDVAQPDRCEGDQAPHQDCGKNTGRADFRVPDAAWPSPRTKREGAGLPAGLGTPGEARAAWR